ncbi:MAG TPA: relaxase domain-containing protein [Streptosporangiaceae bacterium]
MLRAHTHVAVSAKVQGTDGKRRSLDVRALYQMTVAASECYNTAFETALTTLLPGVSRGVPAASAAAASAAATTR